MKRFTALLLLIALTLLSACGPEPPFNPTVAIEPGTGTPHTVRDYAVTHVDTESFPDGDAARILAYAYDALQLLGLDTRVEGIYQVSMGMAANDFSFDPFLIDTTDDGIDRQGPMMVVLHDDDGYCVLLGTFLLAEHEGKDLFPVVSGIFDAAVQDVLARLGLEDTDHQLFFNAAKLYGKDMDPVSTEAKKLFEETQSRYMKVQLCGWDSGGEGIMVGDMYMEPLLDPEIAHVSDLPAYLEKVFTADVAEEMIGMLDPLLYAEVNGRPYFTGIGIGGRMDLQELGPVSICEEGDRLYMLVEAVIVEYDENWEYIVDSRYEDYLFIYAKENGGWRCRKYRDIIYGWY